MADVYSISTYYGYLVNVYGGGGGAGGAGGSAIYGAGGAGGNSSPWPVPEHDEMQNLFDLSDEAKA